MRTRFIVILFIVFILSDRSMAAVTEYTLSIDYDTVNYTGQDVEAMTINGSIPGPVLRFTEGDTARIHVQNKMDVETSIHWHGVLVPPGMDGVPFVSFPPIAPGTTFTYEFPIRQSGTYWYHSHTGLREQKGVYGSIVIEPSESRQKTDRDYVLTPVGGGDGGVAPGRARGLCCARDQRRPHDERAQSAAKCR